MAASWITYYEFSRSGADATMSKPLASSSGEPTASARSTRPCTRMRRPRERSWKGGISPRGDPIIYLMNDYRRGLWNGSLGRIDRVMSSAGVRARACSLDGAEHELLEEDF